MFVQAIITHNVAAARSWLSISEANLPKRGENVFPKTTGRGRAPQPSACREGGAQRVAAVMCCTAHHAEAMDGAGSYLFSFTK
jgi:hypothetical protein